MLLSDAIEKGTLGLMTRGPTFEPGRDVYYAAFRGFFGRDPTDQEEGQMYHNNLFGFGTDTEYALRLMTVYELKWSEVIQRLRGMEL